MALTDIITLLTDFGIEDPYVGIMKGVILSINKISGSLTSATASRRRILSVPVYLKQFFFIFSGKKPSTLRLLIREWEAKDHPFL